MSFLEWDFMQRALLAGAAVGLAGPAVGIFLVQRRLSLMGDGIGHIAFTGIAAGILLSLSPVVMAVVFAIAGGIVMELMRERGRTSGDVALALIFYGGIAAGVLLLSLGDTSTVNVNAYLFGSVLSVSKSDLTIVCILAAVVLGLSLTLQKEFFAIAYDEDVARVSGLPVRALNMAVAAIAAITVAIASKVVGILLVSAMLVLPVAAVQQVTTSFRSTFVGSLVLGVAVTVGGLVLAYYANVLPAATIVLSAIALFALAAATSRLRRST